ncbi:MAG: phosphoribosylformylglycinamidine cyclo-ligase, partial [Lentisphaeria bacterium]
NENNHSAEMYKNAGVDIDRAHDLFQTVKDRINAASRPEMLAPVGGFGGLFQIDLSRYSNPVLVSSIDGVGTKLMVAALAQNYGGIGYDIVNHCIDDIIVQGAEPIYFLDYLGTGKLQAEVYEKIVGGIADACCRQKIALLGGETAEMPGMYGDDIDVVGCITGIVDRDAIYTGSKIIPGDVVVGLESSGLHTNGYSLARKVLFDQCGYDVHDQPAGLEAPIGDLLLRPHTSYWPSLKQAWEKGVEIKGMAHITGGGWYDNLKRGLPEGVAIVCRKNTLQIPSIMRFIQEKSGAAEDEMYRVFNMGIGMAWIMAADEADKAIEASKKTGITAAVFGEISEAKEGQSQVVIETSQQL